VSLEAFTKALADTTRLRILMLLHASGEELCVCQLTQALDQVQPKISRHLAILRESGLLQDRKARMWVYYGLHPDVPSWMLEVLSALQRGTDGVEPYFTDLQRLAKAEMRGSVCLA
jgi:ArsR family transcriptional regulator